MDLISHGLLGVVFGRGFSLDKPYRIMFIISCIIPDIDSISILAGFEEFFQYHRGPTHSFVGMLLIPLAISVVYAGFKRLPAQKFLLILSICLCGTFSHIFLDLITPWSTAFLWPFSNEGISFDITSIFDPIFFATLFLAFLFMKYKNVKKHIIMVIVIVLISTNFGVRYYEKGAAIDTVKEVNDNIVMSMPTFRPDRWQVAVKVVGENGFIYEIYNVDSVHNKILSTTTVESFFTDYNLVELPIDSPEKAVAYSQRDDKVKAFIEKSHLPAVTVTVGDGMWHLVWFDAFTSYGGMSSGMNVTVGIDGTLTVSFSVYEF